MWVGAKKRCGRIVGASTTVAFLTAVTTVACEEEDGVNVSCEPVEAGSKGCVGLPPGAGSSSAVYPFHCAATVTKDGERTYWSCDGIGRWTRDI
jgi:hypothetical protein